MRDTIRRNAYRIGRGMIWSRVAQDYVKSFEQARRDHGFARSKSPLITTLDEQPRQ